jgi:hypothetical protein
MVLPWTGATNPAEANTTATTKSAGIAEPDGLEDLLQRLDVLDGRQPVARL